jgi:methionyl-tRNA formyltransferase
MNFRQIDQFILFGGSPLLSVFAQYLKQKGTKVLVFSSKRHLEELIMQEHLTLEDILQRNAIPYFSCSDINDEPRLRALVNATTLGIGFGEAWSFQKDIIGRFGGKLIDFMGIRLPRYRGGAHYTWQILRRNRIGCCNLQIINEDMVQGVFDSGEIIKRKEYFFPASARIPQDFFDFAVKEELAFLEEFIEEIKTGNDFPLTTVQENFSLFFPRLYTLKHGWINWMWSGPDIELFICAFDDPYSCASTFLGTKRIFLKDCYFDPDDGPFHPFQTGLVYKKASGALFIATKEGTLIVKKATDEDGKRIFDKIKIGQRVFTPQKYLEAAMTYSADYDAEGIKDQKNG